jgi:hypothetical protein
MVKICAWTSSSKTDLTSASGTERLFRNPNKGHDQRPRDRIKSGDSQGVMDDEGAAQAGEWF